MTTADIHCPAERFSVLKRGLDLFVFVAWSTHEINYKKACSTCQQAG